VAGKTSAGILLYRRTPDLQLLLGRLGGPFWARKRTQNWSIPKGEIEPGEAPERTARREFTEELGLPVPDVQLRDLGAVKQKSGKIVQVFAVEYDLDLSGLNLGTFELEWPPKSGRMQEFTELAEVAWVPATEAADRLITAQLEFVDRVRAAIAGDS